MQWWITGISIYAIVLIPLIMLGAMVEAGEKGVFQQNELLTRTEDIAVALIVMIVLLCSYVGLAASVKRYHDRNKSGWFILIAAIPIVGPIIQWVELGFLKGIDEGNKYGEPTAKQEKDPNRVTVGDLMSNP